VQLSLMRRPRQHQQHTAAKNWTIKMTSERQDEVERRLAQSRRLINEASDPLTKERIARFIGDLEQEQKLEDEK
jgi:LPS O-antigen subunit length determinant protein (WzzB/FepE family)